MATAQTIEFREPAARVAEGAKSLMPTPAPSAVSDNGELEGEKMGKPVWRALGLEFATPNSTPSGSLGVVPARV